MVGAQLCKPRENALDNTIAADAHKWKCIFCFWSDARKKPAAHHRPASMQPNLHVLLGEVERGGCL